MSAQRCFTPWNWPMGRPNCSRTTAWVAAVSTHQAVSPTDSAASSTAASPRMPWAAGAHVTTRRGGTERRSARTVATRRVRSSDGARLDVDVGGVHDDPGLGSTVRAARAGGGLGDDGQHEHVGERRRDDGLPRPVHDETATRLGGGGERSGPDAHRPHPLARDQVGHHRAERVAAEPVQGGGRQARGHERARQKGPAQLFDHHHRLGQPEPLAAGGLADHQADPPLRGQVAPERGHHLGVGVDPGPGDGRRAVPVDPATDRVAQRQVLVGEGDARPRIHPPIMANGVT